MKYLRDLGGLFRFADRFEAEVGGVFLFHAGILPERGAYPGCHKDVILASYYSQVSN